MQKGKDMPNMYLYEAMDRLSVQLSQLSDCLGVCHKTEMPESAHQHLEAAIAELAKAYQETAHKWHSQSE